MARTAKPRTAPANTSVKTTPTAEAKALPELARLTELASKYVQPRIEDGFVFHIDEIATTYAAAAVASLALVYAHASGKWFEHLRNEHMPIIIEKAGAEATLENRTQLAAEVSRYATLLGRDLAELWTTSEEEWIDPESGMHRWDAALAKMLRSLGKPGEKMADKVEEKSRKRAEWFKSGAPELAFSGHPPNRAALWKMWVDPSDLNFSRWLRLLSEAVWLHVVGPRFTPRASPVPLVAFRDLATLATVSPQHKLERDEHSNQLIAALDDETQMRTDLLLTSSRAHSHLLDSATSVVKSAYWWPTIEWIARSVSFNEARGSMDPHILRIEGGDHGVREAIGIHHRPAAAEVRKIIDFLHVLSSAAAPGKGRFLTVIRRPEPRLPGAVGRPSITTIIEVGLLLRPKKSRELGLSTPWDTPILPSELIPTIGDHRTKGRQINSVQALTLYIHDHRLDVGAHGWFPLSKAQWRNHAVRWGLYHRSHASLRDRLFDALLDRQCTPSPGSHRVGSEPMLVREGPDRYRLGRTFSPEWSHFVEQGGLSGRQSQKAKKRAILRK